VYICTSESMACVYPLNPTDFICSEGGGVFPSLHNYLLVRSPHEEAGKLSSPSHLRKVWTNTF